MPLSENVRIEIFIPDPDDSDNRGLLDELAIERSYTFGGCTEFAAAGKYRSFAAQFSPTKSTHSFPTLRSCGSAAESLLSNTLIG